MMKLTDLDPRFCRIINPGDRVSEYVDDLARADGIWFLCPKCFGENGGAKGTHQILCWRPHVPQSHSPTPGRWQFEGTGYADLSLVAGSSSVLLLGGCNAHFFVRNGLIVMC